MRSPGILIVLLASMALPLAGQEMPEAGPGEVLTVTISPPAALAETRDSTGRLTLAYAVEVAGEVLRIGQRSGRFTWEPGEQPRFPVTLRVPDRAEAGETEVALVAFQAVDGQTGSVPVRIRVRARRELDLQLAGSRDAAGHDDLVSFTYVLSNQGNAGDSVALSIETNLGDRDDLVPPTLWLAPYEEITGEFQVAVPHDLAVGSQVYIRLSARFGDLSVADHVVFAVLPDRGLFPDLVHIPTTVFLGSTLTSVEGTNQTEPVVAVSGNGSMGRDTKLLYNYRYMPRGGSVYAFRGLLSGPRLFVGVQRPAWGAAVGDLDVKTSELLGFQLQGRGLQGSWRSRGLSLQGMAARPTDFNGVSHGGHVVATEIGFEKGSASGSLVGSSTERTDGLGVPESSVRAALARVQGSRGSHWLGIDAGPMEVANRRTGEKEAGPSVDARYAFRGSRTQVDFRFRRLPGLMADPRLPPSELRAIVTGRPTRAVSASGMLYDEAVPQSLQFVGTRARGGRAGLSWRVRAWTLGLSGQVRRVRGAVDETRRMGRLDAILRAGDFTFDGSLGLGTTRLGSATELAEFYRLGGSWLAERGMLTFHVTLSDDILQPTSTILDAYGLYRLSKVVELYGSATTFAVLESDGFAPVSISDGLTVQTGARFRLAPDRFVFTGVERFSAGGTGEARWRLSAGIQQGLPLPLPLPRPPAATGVVFEDVNGDGLRGDDEPGIDGVMLRMGFERTVSLPGGRFEFRDANPESIQVDPRSLGDDFVPPPAFRVPPDGELEIGLYRAGGLRVTLFLDANADGQWDSNELPAASLSIALVRNGEPWNLRTGPDGSVSLSSLAPGNYLIRIDAESLPSRALPPDVRSVDVRGGETTDVQIAIPLRQISFSQFGDPADACTKAASPCDDD